LSRLRASLAWLLPAGALVGSCGWLGLIEPTETRYAEIAREMLASGDWLIPRLNGIPHFHKPPLGYWSAASGMALLGVNEWGARLGAALAAGFVIWCTARMARQTGGAPAPLAPAFLVSTILFFVLSHQLASDIFLAAAVAGFYAAVLDPRTRATLWPFIALGVGFMAKGPVLFILTVAPVLLASAWARDASPARALASWRGWLLFAAIALPWYLAVMVKTPGLMSYFLHRQLWERYATTVHQRGGPIYYFLFVVLVGALPWTWAALRGWWNAARGAGRKNLQDAILASWVGLPILFFSSSGSKLPAYVLPVFPALALLASCWPRPERRAHWLRIAAVTFALLLALLAAAAPFSAQLGSPRSLAQSIKDVRRPGEHVVEYGVFNAGIPFYLGETVPMLEVERDLGFEGTVAHQHAIITRGDLSSMVNTQGRTWVVGKEAAIQALASALGFKATRMAGSGNQSVLLLEPPG